MLTPRFVSNALSSLRKNKALSSQKDDAEAAVLEARASNAKLSKVCCVTLVLTSVALDVHVREYVVPGWLWPTLFSS